MSEEPIGVVEHYYPRVQAAIVRVEHGTLHEHDMIRIVGKGIDVREPVTSLQINHRPVHEAYEGEVVGVLVREPIPERAQVFRIEP